MSTTAFFEAVENRRTYYALSDKSPITNERIKEVVERSVKYAPSAFDMQAGRVVVVTGQKNKEFWNLVGETHKKKLGDDEDQKAQTDGKIKSFAAGYGTVLFFEEDKTVDDFIGKMPALADAFPVWRDNQAGILQFIVWTALEKEGLGASLQHYGQYSEETRKEVAKFFDIPQTWRSTAMMPFGVPAGAPGKGGEKSFAPLEDRVKVFFD